MTIFLENRGGRAAAAGALENTRTKYLVFVR